ncbi:MAG TPA: hemolysin family protein [Roseiflexaceae bacterium]|nr:hemolysin family protein [Roseiflexaceae bacterium]
MDPESSLYAIGIALCLVLLAFTSAVDTALMAITRHRLSIMQEESATRATVITRLLADPYRFKAAILLLNTATVIAATAFTLRVTDGLVTGWRVGALALLLLLMVIFSEALPKALAIGNPARAAALLAGPMAVLARLLWPLVAVISVLTSPLLRLLSGQNSPQLPIVTEEELRLLVNVGEEEGLIEPDEREMIEGIFSFGDTVVREVMVPRVDIVALEQTASLQEALETVIAHGHSRVPVYDETIDNIVGILYAKDLLPGLRAGQAGMSLRGLLRPPHFVPETMKVDALLKDLQARKVHLAIVVDEYGGTAGLATIEDLLEEIVGEIQDEYDVEEPSVRVVGEGELLADARVLLDDLNDLTDLHLESQESDRLGGLVFERLGRVPRVGDEVHLEDGVTITVLSIEGLRPRQLRVSYQPNGALEVSAPQEEESHDHEHA